MRKKKLLTKLLKNLLFFFLNTTDDIWYENKSQHSTQKSVIVVIAYAHNQMHRYVYITMLYISQIFYDFLSRENRCVRKSRKNQLYSNEFHWAMGRVVYLGSILSAVAWTKTTTHIFSCSAISPNSMCYAINAKVE